MFKILTLVCLGTDPSACTPSTALDIIRGPTVSLQQCMFLGQSQLAGTRLAPDPGEVVKVVCRPAADSLAANGR